MGYKTRCASRTGIYHVMIRGINHENIFGKSLYKHVMKGIMNNKKQEKDIVIFAYCIMDNHMHLLIKAELNDIVNIALHFFLKDVRPMQPLVMNRSIAVS